MEFLTSFIATFITSSVAKTITEPLERVRIQPWHSDFPNDAYGGFLDTLVRVFHERPRIYFFGVIIAFYRASIVNCLRTIPRNLSIGLTKSKVKKMYIFFFPDQGRGDDGSFSHVVKITLKDVIVSTIVGSVMVIFTFPFDFERTNEESDVNYTISSFFGYTRHAIQAYGFLFIYRAYWVTVIGVIPQRIAFNLFYNIIPSYFLTWKKVRETDRKSSWRWWALMQFAFFTALLFASPLEVVRRRLMVSGGEYNHKYDGTVDCFVRIFRDEGFQAFYYGLFGNFIRDYFCSAIVRNLGKRVKRGVERFFGMEVKKKD